MICGRAEEFEFMQKVESLFLEALRASLNADTVQWTIEDVTPVEMTQLFRMAEVHHVVPMIFEAIFECEAAQQMPPQLLMKYKKNVIQSVAMQAMRTAEFQMLFDYLRSAKIKPCVVKGLVCRNLYPNPDARMSGDEDVFIPEAEFERVHQLLLDYGMTLAEPTQDIHREYEVPYGMPGNSIYIELHKHMFPPESEAYGDLNRFFDGIHERSGDEAVIAGVGPRLHAGECGLIEDEINGAKILSMNHTDHLLYLILHSFKHFLHSGFGIRQVCDINLYAMAYGKDIDWAYVLGCLQEVRADLFAVAMFVIGEKYLNFDPEKACYPDRWRAIHVDETAMLDDLLDSGVFGQSNMSRKHSSNITITAMIANNRGKKAPRKGGILRSVFLPKSALVGRYPYLQKFPFLLPVAWLQRVLKYRKETARNAAGNNAAESIKIGNERVELMRKYGIIK